MARTPEQSARLTEMVLNGDSDTLSQASELYKATGSSGIPPLLLMMRMAAETARNAAVYSQECGRAASAMQRMQASADLAQQAIESVASIAPHLPSPDPAQNDEPHPIGDARNAQNHL